MKRITAIVLSLILLVSLSVSASAAAAGTFLLQEYDVTSNDIYCYGKQLPAGGTLEVSAGSRVLEDAALSTLEQEKIPVTLYCLVDSSTSLSGKAAQQREDMLLTFSSLMAEEDSLVLATVDAVLTESKPMDKKDVRDTAITTIAGQSWYTTLYDGISQALNTLLTSTAYNTNRCLVIISDGHDDGKSIATKDDVLKQVQDAGIPVYTAILSANVTEKDVTFQKELAEKSLGGFLSFPDQDRISGSAAAQQIWHSIKGGSVIRVGTEQLKDSGADQQLLIRYDAADTRYEDTILIRAVDLPVSPTEAPTEAPVETTEEIEETTAPETEPAPEEEEGLPMELVLCCGIGGILLIAGIAAFFLLRRKPEPQAPTVIFEDPEDPDPIPKPESDSDSIFISETPPIITPTMPAEDRCHVHAVAIMHPEISVDFYLTANIQTTFGREQKSDILLNPKDRKLSSVHGCFLWNGEILLVQDRQSTNGTAVNGEICPKNVWLRLEDGAVLTAGNYEYRINFKVEP